MLFPIPSYTKSSHLWKSKENLSSDIRNSRFPWFNTWTTLFMFSINRLIWIGFLKLRKLLIMDITWSMENKFLCTEVDTLPYCKNQFNFPFPGSFFLFIPKMLKNQNRKSNFSGTTSVSGINAKIGQANPQYLPHYLLSWCKFSFCRLTGDRWQLY